MQLLEAVRARIAALEYMRASLARDAEKALQPEAAQTRLQMWEMQYGDELRELRDMRDKGRRK